MISQPQLKNRRQNAIMISGIAIAVLFPLALTTVVLFSGMGYPDRILYSRFIFWIEIGLLILYASKAEHQKFLLWEEKPVDAGIFLISVILLYFISIACGIIGNIPRLFGWHESNDILKRILVIFMHRPWLMFFTALTAGVTEELIFRGYILTRLSLMFKNRYIPVIISALLFAALHYSYRSLRELIFTFLIGLIFGLYYQKYRNIKVLIVVHFMIDMISLEIGTHFYKFVK
jgi:membrane protease YdiL (CAAX protease family)